MWIFDIVQKYKYSYKKSAIFTESSYKKSAKNKRNSYEKGAKSLDKIKKKDYSYYRGCKWKESFIMFY